MVDSDLVKGKTLNCDMLKEFLLSKCQLVSLLNNGYTVKYCCFCWVNDLPNLPLDGIRIKLKNEPKEADILSFNCQRSDCISYNKVGES